MAISKERVRWNELPETIQARIEQLVGGSVTAAQNCPGGFSPGLASRLTLADGRRVFVKAMNAEAWPHEAVTHRTEATVAAALPATVPAPQFLGSFDDGQWVALAFEDIDGDPPSCPWSPVDLMRVLDAVEQLAYTATPASIVLPGEHPRLGGWSVIASDAARTTQLSTVSAWATNNIDRLVELEQDGLVAARGNSLVHCDLYPHNILLTPQQVVFVDWPHARMGAPVIDLMTVLSSAAADGVDPEPFLRDHIARSGLNPENVDAVLAAHAGFLLNGGLSVMPVGLEAIAATKLRLGSAAVEWLHRRLNDRTHYQLL